MGERTNSASPPVVDKIIGTAIVTPFEDGKRDRSVTEMHLDSTEDCCSTITEVCATLTSTLTSSNSLPKKQKKQKTRFLEDELTTIKDDEEDCSDEDENDSIEKNDNDEHSKQVIARGDYAEASIRIFSDTGDSGPGSSAAADPHKADEETIPRFGYDQLDMGKQLGKGKFSDIYEASAINPKRRHYRLHSKVSEVSDLDTEEYQGQFAVKVLRRDNRSDPAWFKTGAVKFATETKLLSRLDHPNIMKIYGMSDTSLSDFSAGKDSYYFVIQDQLNDTLEERIYQSWQQKHAELSKRRAKPSFGKVNKVFGKKDGKKSEGRKLERREFLVMRLGIALDIAKALAYLHSNNIVCRDIKPGNIGFDFCGNVKLFNLGLSKELQPDKRAKGKLCKITGAVGSMRYMAPEVFLGQPYGLLADSYSFAVLLWEILSLKKPFSNMTPQKHTMLAVKGNERPSIDLTLSFRMRSLMKRGWAKRIKDRPKMTTICKDLEKEVQRRMADPSSSSSVSSFSSRLSVSSFASFASFVSKDSSLNDDDLNTSYTTYDCMSGSSSSVLFENSFAMTSS